MTSPTTAPLVLDERIKSRPEYPPVALKQGVEYQVFISQGSDSGLKDLFEQCRQSAAGTSLWLEQEQAQESSLNDRLASVGLSAAVYIHGDEPFLWDTHKVLVKLGFEPEQIQLQATDNRQRRLFCTHCYTLMEGVSHSPHRCEGCGELLLVRDHFSRLHGAYVGVSINAEDRSETFEPEEVQ